MSQRNRSLLFGLSLGLPCWPACEPFHCADTATCRPDAGRGAAYDGAVDGSDGRTAPATLLDGSSSAVDAGEPDFESVDAGSGDAAESSTTQDHRLDAAAGFHTEAATQGPPDAGVENRTEPRFIDTGAPTTSAASNTDSSGIGSDEQSAAEDAGRLQEASLGPSCSEDADCTDFEPCNGEELCEQAHCRTTAPLDCDDNNACTQDACVPGVGCEWTLEDGDGDGRAPESLGSCGTDCDDADPEVYAGAAELCDFKDNNCNDDSDEQRAPQTATTPTQPSTRERQMRTIWRSARKTLRGDPWG